LHEAGIALRFSVMGGLFDETPEEARASRLFLARNAEKIGIDVVQMLVVERGTRLAADAGAYNLELFAGQELMGNDGFSYLGGRLGPAFQYCTGADRAARSEELRALADAVLPAKNDEPHPRFRRPASPPAKAPGLVRLMPWVSVVGGERDPHLLDLRWAIGYRLPGGVSIDRSTSTLRARSAGAASLLARLVDADIGVPLEPAEGGAA
jgi:hypothetical protein